MILLDTNVLSSLMRREADPVVIGWLDAQPPESIWTTAITLFEIRFGLAILAEREKECFGGRLCGESRTDFEGWVLPFDHAAADAAAAIAARQRQIGRPIAIRDVQIAGIAISREATLATRNTRHFEGTGVALVDPWST